MPIMPEVAKVTRSTVPMSASPEGKNPQDVAIADSAADGALEDQLEAIMRKNNQALFRTARSILRDDSEAEEAVQSAYLMAFSKKGQFSGGPNLSAWLRKITVNRALDRLRQLERERRAKEMRREVDTEWRAGTEFSLTPEDVSAKREMLEMIERASDELPDTLRSVFMLRDVQELSGAETADCLGIAEGAVRVRLSRARALMRTCLGKQAEGLYKSSFEFAGERCDRIVNKILGAFRNLSR